MKSVENKLKFHEHNDILRASYKLNPNSLKLLGYNLNQLKYTEGNKIEIKKEILFQIIPTFRKRKRLLEALESLKSQTVDNLHKELLFTVWISAVKETEDSYVFEFPQLLLEYLRPFIATEMTNINLYYYFKLSKYISLRLYKLFSQYIETTKKYIVNYEDFKKILNIDRTRENDNMQSIKIACEEIGLKTDIKVNAIHKVYKNRKVQTLTFFLEKQETEEYEVKEAIPAAKIPETPAETPEAEKEELKTSDNIIEWFESVWSKYPRKEGKSRIIKSSAKLKILYKDKINVEIALKNFTEKVKNTETKFIMQGSRFFGGDYKDFIVPEKLEKTEKKFSFIN